jgi:hypothetical protein
MCKFWRSPFSVALEVCIETQASAALLDADKPLVEAGVARSVKPLHIAGTTCSTVAEFSGSQEGLRLFA